MSNIVDGCDYNDIKYEKKVSLCKNIAMGNTEKAKLLIEQGADLNEVESYSARNANDRDTALIVSLRAGDDEIAELLIKKGANVNANGRFGDTASHQAAWRRNNKILELLAKNGADLNIQDEEGNTPLIVSAWTGDIITMKILLENGADVNAMDDTMHSTLIISTMNKNMEMVKFLLEHNADINIQDIAGRSSLHVAVCMNDTKLVKIFLRQGINTRIKTHHSSLFTGTALNIAIDDNSKEIVEILEHYSRVIPLQNLCLLVIRKNKIDKQFLPEILFKFPSLKKNHSIYYTK